MYYMTLFNIVLITLVVTLHFATLTYLSNHLYKLKISARHQILVSFFVLLFIHSVEIWLFAFGFYLLIHPDVLELGQLVGDTTQNLLLDCSYFSFTTYTTVGIGDIRPTGDLRFLAAMESLTGFLLITWSASYIFLEMQRHWSKKI